MVLFRHDACINFAKAVADFASISNCLRIFYARGEKHTSPTCFVLGRGLDIQYRILAELENKVLMSSDSVCCVGGLVAFLLG